MTCPPASVRLAKPDRPGETPAGCVARAPRRCGCGRARGAHRDRRRPRRNARRHPDARWRAQAARDERRLQHRHGQRVLHGQQPARARLDAAARVVRERADLPRLDQARRRRRRGAAGQRQRHQRRRQDVHLQDPPGRAVGHLAAAPGDGGRLRARVQAALQPDLARGRARLLHEHHRRHEGLLRRLRQGQEADRRRHRRIRVGPQARRCRRDRSLDAHVQAAPARGGLPQHPDDGLRLRAAGRVRQVPARQRGTAPAHDRRRPVQDHELHRDQGLHARSQSRLDAGQRSAAPRLRGQDHDHRGPELHQRAAADRGGHGRHGVGHPAAQPGPPAPDLRRRQGADPRPDRPVLRRHRLLPRAQPVRRRDEEEARPPGSRDGGQQELDRADPRRSQGQRDLQPDHPARQCRLRARLQRLPGKHRGRQRGGLESAACEGRLSQRPGHQDPLVHERSGPARGPGASSRA